MVSKLLCHAFVQYANRQRVSFTQWIWVGIVVGMVEASSTYWIGAFLSVSAFSNRLDDPAAERCDDAEAADAAALKIMVKFFECTCVYMICAHVSKAFSVRNGLQS